MDLVFLGGGAPLGVAGSRPHSSLGAGAGPDFHAEPQFPHKIRGSTEAFRAPL